MITISPEGKGYKMKFSSSGTPGARRFSAKARNLKEIHQALNHHYLAHVGGKSTCPLCSLEEKESKR